MIAYSYGFRVHPHYRKLTVWAFDRKTRQLVSTDTFVPLRGQTYDERRDTLQKKLAEFKIKSKI
jgi:hypothetical protein